MNTPYAYKISPKGPSTLIPACLYKHAKQDGALIPCLCDTCKGTTLHSGNSHPHTSSKVHTQPLPAITIPQQATVLEPNADQLRGQTCFYCDQKKEKTLPAGKDELNIGRWRTIKFCQKGEIREAQKRTAIEKAIDAEIATVREGDKPPITDEYQSSQPEEQQEEEDDVECDGYRDEAGTQVCTTTFKPILTIKVSGGKDKHFCKASHLIRYLIKHHTTKGKTSKKSPKTKNKEKEKEDNIQEDEAHTPIIPTPPPSPQAFLSTSLPSSSTRGRGRGKSLARGRGKVVSN
jgi:hypothetical protein